MAIGPVPVSIFMRIVCDPDKKWGLRLLNLWKRTIYNFYANFVHKIG